jgi:predicted metal-dependent phosphoesterase TrpH
MNGLDLHVHSDLSDDGEWPAERIVGEAFRLGIGTLAIADHNRTRAVAPAQRAAAEYGITVIPAIEIDCCHAGVNLHVLGYGIDPLAVEFEALYTRLVAQENAALSAKLELMAAYGIGLDPALLIAQAGGRAVTGEQIAEALLQDRRYAEHPLLQPYRGGAPRADNPLVNFYWDWFHQGQPFHVPVELPALGEMVGLIADRGGVSVLAHPGVNLARRPDLLDAILKCGVEGIEVFNSYHSSRQTAHYLAEARSRSLLVTCGSDFHGRAKPGIALGQCHCDWPAQDIVGPLLERLAAGRRLPGSVQAQSRGVSSS